DRRPSERRIHADSSTRQSRLAGSRPPSTARTLLGIALQRGDIGAARGLGGEFQCRYDVVGCQLRPGSNDLFARIAIGDTADDYADGDPRALDAGLPVMDARIEADPIAPIHVKLTCGRTRSANS